MQLTQAITQRRSINYFDPERKIDEKTVTDILNLAALAPSSMNLQPWKVITVLSDEKKAVLRSVSYGQPKVTEASAVFILLADKTYAEKNINTVLESMIELGYMDKESAAEKAKTVPNSQGAPDSFLREKNAVLNTALFGMNLMYACAVYGIETHPMGGFEPEKLRKEFDIADNLVPVMLVAAGYLKPGTKLLPRVKRLSSADFNHIL
ncbi:nitroreductase [Denitrovibrio acetiphilus DSM 12809]|uniref:Nitroreductase n=1 Tax=Denitrovibrio acetiphilus (strain DSM 12809 / NBRC 114555 / N2460) TaxID=522772 RepID=D4H3N5_DENA2|nr:nitroreductase family protein [Denitrovibrio acetiphilus]ADD69137.1 nitroreductase [Denitrovibrio acetiphilus DSM 12809]